jgi:predicted  nucleic acid-binding Zn-ribbon protein
MNPVLEQIIILQDLDLMIREISDKKTASQLRKIGFAIDEAGRLQEARSEIAAKVDREVLSAYERLMHRYPRAVVPVKNGTCLACFIKQPTRYSASDTDQVRFCEQCKRILYAI